MADHVELSIAQLFESAGLLRELLHTVLAEQPLACFVRFEDAFGREGFGYRHQRHVVWISTGALSCARDTLMNGGEIGGDGHRTRARDSCKVQGSFDSRRRTISASAQDDRICSVPLCLGGDLR